MSKFVWPKRHMCPTKKNATNQKHHVSWTKKITLIQVDLPVQISDLWASLDTDGDGRVRMEVRISPTRRGRDDPPVTDQTRWPLGEFPWEFCRKEKMAGESYFFALKMERLFHIFPLKIKGWNLKIDQLIEKENHFEPEPPFLGSSC